MAFTAGDRVTVRGERWVVQEATAFADGTLLGLSSAGRSARAPPLLPACHPFDRPVATSAQSANPRDDRGAGGCITCMRICPSVRAFGELRAPQRAAIDILPFQLEPALALVRGHASRFLLADEVGLGKTIQAGLMLAELQQRGWCERALIITPAGLRQQWADELRHRFDIRAAVVDAASLAALTDSLPFDVNPWTVEPVAIASIDFLKQPEVLRGARRAAVGHPDRRRGASGDDRIPALRRRQRAGTTRAARGAPHRHAACRRRSRVSSALRNIGDSRRARSDAALPPNAGTGGPAAIAPRASAARDAHAG